MESDATELRLRLAETSLATITTDLAETKKLVLTLERQLRDARIILTVLGLVGLAGGGFVAHVYHAISEMGAQVDKVSSKLNDADRQKDEYIRVIRTAADTAKTSVASDVRKMADESVTSAVHSSLSGSMQAFDARITSVTTDVGTLKADLSAVAIRLKSLETRQAAFVLKGTDLSITTPDGKSKLWTFAGAPVQLRSSNTRLGTTFRIEQ